MAVETRPVRVLMILESAFPSVGGGAEAQVRTLARGLKARGHRVTVLAPLAPNGPPRRLDRIDGVPVCRLAYPRLPLLGGPLLWLRLALFLYARRGRYDAWHVHIAHYLGAVAAWIGVRLRVPVLVKVSGWWELERGTLAENAGPGMRLAYRGLLSADAWLAISRRIGTALIEKGVPIERIVALPNAVDTERFARVEPSPSETIRFVYFGRLVPEKGLETLLEAFSLTLAHCPRARLRVVGNGPLRTALKATSERLGIAAEVEFLAHSESLEALLSEADFGVLPSRIEGLSNTLLESLAAGLPMIASRVSGSEDVVVPGVNGWLFEPDDSAALAACLIEAATLPVERRGEMARQARRTVREYASLDTVLSALLKLYRSEKVGLDQARRHTGRGG